MNPKPWNGKTTLSKPGSMDHNYYIMGVDTPGMPMFSVRLVMCSYCKGGDTQLPNFPRIKSWDPRKIRAKDGGVVSKQPGY